MSALTAYDLAQSEAGAFLLRFEDIDRSRSRTEWEVQALTDLAWLGVRLREPPLRQSERMEHYARALDDLWRERLLYQCHCSRADIRAALASPQEGDVQVGPDGLVYPGTCRDGPRSGPRPEGVLRLDMAAAVARSGAATFAELSERRDVTVSKAVLVGDLGDVVLARAGMGTSYHLSVVVDDAEQHITHVVRGQDLFDTTAIHVVLQRLLGLPTPLYLHHRLVRDADGRRLAKRHDARAVTAYRAAGATPFDLRRMVGLPYPVAMSSVSRPSRTAV